MGFDYVIRFRGVVTVESAAGECQKASGWVGGGGRIRVLRSCHVTADRVAVPTVVCVQQQGMKDAWCLASSRCDLSGTEIKRAYGRRFSIEETLRDAKNARLGQASRELGMERWLGASREGGISLFRQGLLLYELLPTMNAERRRALLERFGEILRRHELYTNILGLL